MNQFSVVTFPDEGSVAVVASVWLSEDKSSCMWPAALGSKLKKLILTSACPTTHPKKQWSWFRCCVLGSYDKHATQKSKKAEDDSNLETTAIEETPRQGKRRRLTRKVTKSSSKPTLQLAKSSSDFSSSDSEGGSVHPTKIPSPPSMNLFSSTEASCDIHLNSVSYNHPVNDLISVFSLTDILFQLNQPTQPEIHNISSDYSQLLQKIQQDREEHRRFQAQVINKLVEITQTLQELITRTATAGK